MAWVVRKNEHIEIVNLAADSLMHRIKLGYQIGCGRQGNVYVGYHKEWNEQVIVKKFNSRAIAALEAHALQKASGCTQIPRFYELIEEHDATYILMEHVHGSACDYIVDLAQQGMYITETEIRHIVHDVSHALKHLHGKMILYADLKPSNVLFIPPSDAKLVDLGCAREGIEFMQPLGTPLFFAPEKFSWTYSYPSDVWSLGVFTYMLICGIHPFVHQPERLSDIYELEHEILSTPFGFYHPRWDMVSKDGKHILEKMLHKDPEKRFTIEDVVQHPWIASAPKKIGNTMRRY